MYVLYFLLSIILFGVIIQKEKTLITPSSIIVLTWAVFPCIACMRPYGLNELHAYTHVIILTALFSFIFAYYHEDKKRFHFRAISGVRLYTTDNINYKLLFVLNLICLVFMIPKTLAAYTSIQMIGWDGQRDAYYELFGSYGEISAFNVFFKPLFIASLAILSVDLLRNEKYSIKRILLTLIVIINIAQESIIFAARATLVKVVVFFVFSFLFVNRKEISRRKKILFLLILFIVYNVITFITIQRAGNLGDSSILRTMTIYYIAPFAFLDYLISNPEYSKLGVDNLLLGLCMIGFLYNFIYSALTYLFNIEYLGSDYAITSITAENVPVAASWHMNAACTACYPFMRDFGILGVLIGFAISAIIIQRIKYKFLKAPNVRNGALYVFMLYCIFRLSVNYDFLFTATYMAIVYIYMGTMTRKELYRFIQ